MPETTTACANCEERPGERLMPDARLFCTRCASQVPERAKDAAEGLSRIDAYAAFVDLVERNRNRRAQSVASRP